MAQPSWPCSRLPFLGKPFSGMKECVQYCSSLSQTPELSSAKDAFPSVSGWRRVCR
ncbi:uncharacterized protein K444DRAFT_541453 [Hyaloscypha bicolor E]|uniref:Uncharacterized protein n=1 Tax=Hyaloscypha bicolor E TaxID=1095630 RepID=A0A2J6SS69_9HELO|nr:uncharacterized protein K444DRAFT_541453 [Hyaloscypha bicolor E]PMD53590.1 hypothetical protein K444DRAFT_541453 [Hyaloscypha bicolor E]